MKCIKTINKLVGVFKKVSDRLVIAIEKCKVEVACREELITELRVEQSTIKQSIDQAEKLRGNIDKLLS